MDGTNAGRGWLLAATGENLTIVAGAGPGAGAIVGSDLPAGVGWAGAVVRTRRPMAITPDPTDPHFAGDPIFAKGGRPTSLLCFPCDWDGRTVGALLLVDKLTGRFGLDDVELAEIIAAVAGAALVEALDGGMPAPPEPAALDTGLHYLASTDPGRYATVAAVLEQLLLLS